MKKIILLTLSLLSCVVLWAQRDVKFYMNSGEIKSIAVGRIDSLSFDDAQENMILHLQERCELLSLALLDSICYGELLPSVNVEYRGSKAVVENPFAFDSVAVSIEGAKVTVNSFTQQQIEYRLSGESQSGAFKIYGEKKFILSFAGLNLANDCGAAINSQCSKRGKIILESGTVNTICDASEYSSLLAEDEKGAIFSEGQLIFESTGELNVSSLYKHAIISDDYIEIRDGKITVSEAIGDAIHANDSVIVAGGDITLTANSDGIDCDGVVRVQGGKLNMTLPGNDIKGIKSGSDIFVSGGEILLNMSGNIAKGLKSKGITDISAGDIDITMSGNSLLLNDSPSYAVAIKSDTDVYVSGGNVKLTATGIAGRGISADGTVNISDGACTIVCSGNNQIYVPGEEPKEEEQEKPVTYVLYVNAPTSSNTGGWPGGNSSTTWRNIYLYDSSDNLIATLTNSVVINGTTFYYYDFGAEVTGSYYFKSDNSKNYVIKSSTFNGLSSDTYYKINSSYSTSGSTRTYSLSDVTDSYKDAAQTSAPNEDSFAAAAIKSDSDFVLSGGTHTITISGTESKGVKSDANAIINGGTLVVNSSGKAAIVAADPSYCTAIKSDGNFEMNGGVLTITATGTGCMGVSADGTLTVNGGEANINISGSGSSYTSTSGTDYYSTKCIKSDKEMNLLGGSIYCNAIGNGSKCIVADGVLTIGDTSNSLTLSAKTSGSSLGTSSSGGMGGGGFGGPMGGGGFNGAPKAIKGKSSVVVNGGNIYVETKADGGEGLESKTTMTINGGTIQCKTYDDGINASSNLTVNGGYIYCYATNNDGIDSNGTFNFNGGVILTSGASSPEEGFDCDQNNFTITGGLLIGTGGATSNPKSASQYYSVVQSVGISSGKYISVKNSAGELLFSYKCPNTISSGTVLVSSPDFSSSSHTMMYNVTSVSGSTESYFDDVLLVGGAASGGSSKNFTPSLK